MLPEMPVFVKKKTRKKEKKTKPTKIRSPASKKEEASTNNARE